MANAPSKERKRRAPVPVEVVDNGEFKHYIYRHIRLGKNEPFYIGVGSKYKGSTNMYQRARDYQGRSELWARITEKDGYKIQIIFTSDDYNEILEKEKEFISMYGRINTNTGILANLTDGGGGVLNIIYSPERIKQLTEAKLGTKASLETRKRMSEAHKKRQHRSSLNCLSKAVYQYSTDGVFIKKWYSIMDVERDIGIDNTKVSQATKKPNNYNAGYFWFSKYMGVLVEPKPFIKRSPIKAINIDGNVVGIYETIKQGALALFNNKNAISCISKRCSGKRKIPYKDLYFQYVN